MQWRKHTIKVKCLVLQGEYHTCCMFWHEVFSSRSL